MSTQRLTAEQVDASAREMWDAIAGIPADDEDRQGVIDQARNIEAKLRLRLAAQDRLDQAAPLLLEGARLFCQWCTTPDQAVDPEVIEALHKAYKVATGAEFKRAEPATLAEAIDQAGLGPSKYCARVNCSSCNWRGYDMDMAHPLKGIPNLEERLDPGAVVPAGDCPHCGALCYLDQRGM